MTAIVVSQYEIQQLPSFEAYEDKIVRLVESAKESNAKILLLGEYAGLELASWSNNSNLSAQFEFIQKQLPAYQQLFLSLANEHDIYIQPGTLPVLEKDGYYRNRAFLFSPSGEVAYQDKIFLSRFELQSAHFQPANSLNVFVTSIGTFGINISYDNEFPFLAQQLTTNGAGLILIPSCTERISGLTRVAVTARARAIENQCYVAHSCLIGKASWSNLIDISVGQSGIYCPADINFYEDGIIAQTQLNTPMCIATELDFSKLNEVHERGEMQNFSDMQADMDAFLDSIVIIEMN